MMVVVPDGDGSGDGGGGGDGGGDNDGDDGGGDNDGDDGGGTRWSWLYKMIVVVDQIVMMMVPDGDDHLYQMTMVMIT